MDNVVSEEDSTDNDHQLINDLSTNNDHPLINDLSMDESYPLKGRIAVDKKNLKKLNEKFGPVSKNFVTR